MSSLDELLAARQRLWDEHPIITESATLPTRAVKDAVARVMLSARKSRSSIAFWADPVTGKTSCIRAIKKAISDRFPDAGVLMLEAVEDKQQAEGRLLISILMTIGYAHQIDRALAGKRDQVKRALIALSGSKKRLFILIDEAQEVSNDEFAWLKAVINALSGAGIKVTTVMFGQRELKGRKENLQSKGRSDLCERFMKNLMEFRGVRTKADLEVICSAIEEYSEFPPKSGWTYTAFLFPRAHLSGFRFAGIASAAWDVIKQVVPATVLKDGLSMEVVAGFLANLCISCRGLDTSGLVFTDDQLTKALQAALGK